MSVTSLKRFAFIFIFVTFFWLANNIANSEAQSSFSITVPNNGNLIAGCINTATIIIDPGGYAANAVDILIEYDKDIIEIIDSDDIEPGVQIIPGEAFEAYPLQGNKVDTQNGTIRLLGVSFSASLNTQKIFGYIKFMAKSAGASGSFNIIFRAGDTIESNIAERGSGNDVLLTKYDTNFSFSEGKCVEDNSPPNVIFKTPKNFSKDFPRNGQPELQITDEQSGINISTLTVILNGKPYQYGSENLTIIGNIYDYRINLKPLDYIPENIPSSLQVLVQDIAGNERFSAIVFNIPELQITNTPSPTPIVPITLTPTPTEENEDNDSPSIKFIKPNWGEYIGENDVLNLVLSDSQSGIDIASLIISVNGSIYKFNDNGVNYSGNKNQYTITIPYKSIKISENIGVLTIFISDYKNNKSASSIIFSIKTDTTDNPKEQKEPIGVEIVKNISSATEDIVGEVSNKAGPLSPFIVILFIPYMIFGIILLGGIVSQICSIILFKDKQKFKVLDSITNQGVDFVTIKIVNLYSGKIKKLYSIFGGRFTFNPDGKEYKFYFSKHNYIPFSSSIERDADGVFPTAEFKIKKIEEKDFFYRLQFTQNSQSPFFYIGIFGILISILNCFLDFNIFSFSILIISIIIFTITIIRNARR